MGVIAADHRQPFGTGAPLRGELIPGPGLLEFEVLDADPRRVKRVRIVRLTEKRQKPREPKKRGEPDAVLAGVAQQPLNFEIAPSKDSNPQNSSQS